jgi:hypothetical protein
VSLFLVPFIRIGKQGLVKKPSPDPEGDATNQEKQQSSTPIPASLPSAGSEKSLIKDVDHRPSKRWSPVGSVIPSSTGRRSTRAQSISSQSSQGIDSSKSESAARTAIRRGRCSSEKIMWIVCEECGTSKRHRESSSQTVVGDPARYFNDVVHGVDSTTGSRDPTHYQAQHQPHTQASRSSPSRLGSPIRHKAAQRHYPGVPGRRRLPMVNRQIMTHQILTQGFQPTMGQSLVEQGGKNAYH